MSHTMTEKTERITERRLQQIIWNAYFAGRDAERKALNDERDGKGDWCNSFPSGYEETYALTCTALGAYAVRNELEIAFHNKPKP